VGRRRAASLRSRFIDIDGHTVHPALNAKRVVVAYDVHLADRVRDLLVDGSPVTEQLMFGGLAFLAAGKIVVAASSQGGLLVRVDPARADVLLATTNARPMERKGQVIRGWLHVDGDDLRTERQLAQWIAVGTATARNAPAKRPNR
jgi:TfoX/Sxy family transcriptional regulator of competence genes